MKWICKNIVLSIVVALMLLAIAEVTGNHLNTNFEQLNKVDQKILQQLDTIYNNEEFIWKNFCLEQKTVLAISGKFGNAYLVNPRKEINSFFAVKIKMPEGCTTQVYRISKLYPDSFKSRFDIGNFNTINKKYSIQGNEVYFIRYEEEVSLGQKYSSNHFAPFLAHESFHYYMQNQWATAERFDNELSEEDLKLLEEELEILTSIQKELFEEDSDKNMLILLAQKYIAVVEKRIEKNPKYLEKEQELETVEGSATYVGIKAAGLVGYDYGIMYFNNVKNVPFNSIVETYRSGKIEHAFIRDKLPYETGALLCFLLEKLEIEGWQERLNQQKKNDHVTLYQLVKESQK